MLQAWSAKKSIGHCTQSILRPRAAFFEAAEERLLVRHRRSAIMEKCSCTALEDPKEMMIFFARRREASKCSMMLIRQSASTNQTGSQRGLSRNANVVILEHQLLPRDDLRID